MADRHQCKFDRAMQVELLWRFGIKAHALFGIYCQNIAHQSFNDLMEKTDGNLSYTTPLLDACMKGNFEDVQRMIEVWRVDVEAGAILYLNSDARLIGFDDDDGLHTLTPLFVAALKNDVELVHYLVGKGADVSSRTWTGNKSPFSGITPLHAALLHVTYSTSNSWEADSSNQTEVIRILLESGADPSALSSDGTPTWMFSWIRFYYDNDLSCKNSHNVISNISVISLLLEYGMSIDQRCPRFGRTLLHYMANSPADESIIYKICKLLIEKGADFQVRDRDGITPILFAVVGNNVDPNMVILKFLIEQVNISNMDKIEALEVAAAILLPDRLRNTDIEYCLSRARELRKIEGASLIPKTSLNGRAVEWATSSGLENIMQRQYELKMQSILIRLRIFSAKSWGAIYHYLWPYVSDFIKSRDLSYATYFPISPQQLAELVDISWTMLETIRRFAPTSDVEEISLVTGQLIPTFTDTLFALKKKNDPLFNVETLKTSFELLSTTLQAQLVCENDVPLTSSTIYSLGKMFSFLVDLPDVMIHPIIDYLKEIVKLNNQDSNQEKLIIFACMKAFDKTMVISPFHLSLEVSSTEADVENTLAFLRFLLRFGADPDAVDHFGNGPLHLLAAEPNGVYNSAIAQLLLDSGAHLDRTNKKGLTAADVWKQKRQQERKRRREEGQPARGAQRTGDALGYPFSNSPFQIFSQNFVYLSPPLASRFDMMPGVTQFGSPTLCAALQPAVKQQDFPDWLRGDVPRLMCLSARTIRSHRVPYLKVLPPSLQSFVSFH